MECLYVRCSVLSDDGIEELISTTITKCMELENLTAGSGQDSKKDAIFSLGGSDGLTSGDVKNINPMKLQVKKRNKPCCGD